MASLLDQIDPLASRTSLLDRLSQGQQVDPREKEAIDQASVNSMGEFEKGLRRFGYSALSTSEAFAGQIAEPFAPEFTKKRIASAMETTRSMPNSLRPKYQTFDEASAAGDYAPYVAGALGEGLGSVGTMVAAGLLTRGAALRASPAAQNAAGYLGGAGAMLPMEGGETALSLREDPVAMANTTPGQRTAMTVGRGGVNALLESAVPTALLTNQIAGAGRRVAPGLRSGAANIGRKIAAGTIGEAGTEAAQDLTGQYVQNLAAPGTGYDFAPTKEAAIRGGLTGGVLGGAGGTIQAGFSNVQAGTDRAVEETRTRGSEALNTAVASIYDIINNPANVAEDVTNMSIGALVEAKTKIPDLAFDAAQVVGKGVDLATDSLIEAEAQFSDFILNNIEPENQLKYADLRNNLRNMTVVDYRRMRDELMSEASVADKTQLQIGKAAKNVKKGAKAFSNWTTEIRKGVARARKNPEEGVAESLDIPPYSGTQLEELADLYSMLDPKLGKKLAEADPEWRRAAAELMTTFATNANEANTLPAMETIKKRFTSQTGGAHLDDLQGGIVRMRALFDGMGGVDAAKRLNSVFEKAGIPEKDRAGFVNMLSGESYADLKPEEARELSAVRYKELTKKQKNQLTRLGTKAIKEGGVFEEKMAQFAYQTPYAELSQNQKDLITNGTAKINGRSAQQLRGELFYHDVVQTELGNIFNNQKSQAVFDERQRIIDTTLGGLGFEQDEFAAVQESATAKTFSELSPEAQQAFIQAEERDPTVRDVEGRPRRIANLFRATREQLAEISSQKIDKKRAGQVEGLAPKTGTGASTAKILQDAEAFTDPATAESTQRTIMETNDLGQIVLDDKGRTSPYTPAIFQGALRAESLEKDKPENKRTKKQLENSIPVELYSDNKRFTPEVIAELIGYKQREFNDGTLDLRSYDKNRKPTIKNGKFVANINLKSLWGTIQQSPEERETFEPFLPTWSKEAATNPFAKKEDENRRRIGTITALDSLGIEVDPETLPLEFRTKHGIRKDGPLIKIIADVDVDPLIGEGSNVLLNRDQFKKDMTFPEAGVNYGSSSKLKLAALKGVVDKNPKGVLKQLEKIAKKVRVQNLYQEDSAGNPIHDENGHIIPLAGNRKEKGPLMEAVRNNRRAVSVQKLIGLIKYQTAENKKLDKKKQLDEAGVIAAVQADLQEKVDAGEARALKNNIKQDGYILAEAIDEGVLDEDFMLSAASNVGQGTITTAIRKIITEYKDKPLVLPKEKTEKGIKRLSKANRAIYEQTRELAEMFEAMGALINTGPYIKKDGTVNIDRLSMLMDGFNEANKTKKEFVEKQEESRSNLVAVDAAFDWDGAFEAVDQTEKRLREATARIDKRKRGKDKGGELTASYDQAVLLLANGMENNIQEMYADRIELARTAALALPPKERIAALQELQKNVTAFAKKSDAVYEAEKELHEALLKSPVSWTQQRTRLDAEADAFAEQEYEKPLAELNDEERADIEAQLEAVYRPRSGTRSVIPAGQQQAKPAPYRRGSSRYNKLNELRRLKGKQKFQDPDDVSAGTAETRAETPPKPPIAKETLTREKGRISRALDKERARQEELITQAANNVKTVEGAQALLKSKGLAQLTKRVRDGITQMLEDKIEDLADPDGAPDRVTKRAKERLTPEQKRFRKTIETILGGRVIVLFDQKLGGGIAAQYQEHGDSYSEIEEQRTNMVKWIRMPEEERAMLPDDYDPYDGATNEELKVRARALQELADAKRDDVAVQGIIRVATGMEANKGVAEHEALHGAFRLLFAHRKEDRRVLTTAFTTGQAGRRLREFYKDSPEVLAKIDPNNINTYNAEEAAAYGFQVWSTDPQILKLGEKGQGIFEKIAQLFRSVFNIMTTEQKAAMLLKDLRSGATAETGITALQRYQDREFTTKDHIVEVPKALGGAVSYFTNKLLSSTYSRLEATENPALAQIARLGYVATGEESGERGTGFVQRMRIESTARLNKLGEMLSELGDEKDIQAMYEKHVSTRVEGDDDAFDTFFQELRQYQIEAGVELGDAGPKYFPMPWDPIKVMENRQAFIAMLEKYQDNDYFASDLAETPAQIWDNIAAYAERGETLTDVTGQNMEPVAGHARTRFLAFLTPEERRPFMSDNADEVLSHYVQQATRNAEFVRAYGKNASVLERLLNEARDTYGASGDDIALAKDYVDGLLGNKGQGMSRELKDAYGAMTLYQNVRLLPFSTFSSLVDPLGIAVRTGDGKAAFEAFTYSLKNLFRDWKKEYTPDQWEQIATDNGFIEASGTPISTDARYTGITLTGKTRKWNDTFFRMNLLNGMVRNHHIMATKAADKFLLRASEGFFGEEESARYLQEIGLTAEDVVYDESLQRNLISEEEFIAAGYDKESGEAKQASERIRQAMGTVVRQSLISPSSAEMPEWMSNPYLAPIAHLKSFVFGFNKTIIERLTHEARHGNNQPLLYAAAYVPGMIAADFLKDMVSNAGDEPAYKKDWGIADYTKQGVYRSGLTGAGQFFTDAGNDMTRGGYGIESFLGPSVEQAGEWYTAVKSGSGERFWTETVDSLPANAIYDQWVDP